MKITGFSGVPSTCKEPALRSTDIRARARERAISHYHNTRIEPCVRRLFPLVKSPGPDTAQAVREALAQMGEQLQRLETVVSPDPFVSGASLRIPDCTFPATLFMGQDIFAHLGATLELPETIECWLQNTLTMPIVAEEVARNRAAVTAWLAGFSPAPTPGN